MADDKVGEAAEIVARQAAYMAISAFLDDEPWEGHFPELGENDWLLVEARATTIAQLVCPEPDEYQAAYEFLESRAEK